MSGLDAELAELSESKLTPLLLRALDAFVPGEWADLTSLQAIAAEVSGQSDPTVVRRIADRAEALYADPDRPYRTALRLYASMDTLDRVGASAIAANKVGEHISLLGFLNRVTPKPDTVQAIDAAAKLAAELAAFSLLHGLPKASVEGVTEFAGALAEYGRAEGMRLAGWVIIDGVIPLGPDFVQLVAEKLDQAELGNSKMFAAVRDWLPGEDDAAKRGFLGQALGSVSGWVDGFIAEHGITQAGVRSTFSSVVDAADSGSEVLAAALDASTNYFTHTGTQTVARYAVQEAWEQVQEELAAEAEQARVTAEQGPQDGFDEEWRDRGPGRRGPPPWARGGPPGRGPGLPPPRHRGPPRGPGPRGPGGPGRGGRGPGRGGRGGPGRGGPGRGGPGWG